MLKLKSTKRPKNKAEGELWDLFVKNGWFVTKQGYPDFFCMKNDKICFVEVKPTKTQRLKRSQILLMNELSKRGIDCYKWTPDGGFEKI